MDARLVLFFVKLHRQWKPLQKVLQTPVSEFVLAFDSFADAGRGSWIDIVHSHLRATGLLDFQRLRSNPVCRAVAAEAVAHAGLTKSGNLLLLLLMMESEGLVLDLTRDVLHLALPHLVPVPAQIARGAASATPKSKDPHSIWQSSELELNNILSPRTRRFTSCISRSRVDRST